MRLEIDGREANIKFSACHLITEHSKCGRLHGHVYVLRMIVYGEKGDHGMIMDFTELKKIMRRIVDEFDHRVLLAGNCPRMKITIGEEVIAETSGKRYVFPIEDVIIIDAEETSAEEVARVLLSRVLSEVKFPSNVTKIEIGVDEERGQSAWISYDLK
ncbi:MAG: 6-pyruvoyl tetrahydropterin synthase family protein [Methanomassiliicoccales archaeon]|jgi:6-pyruvoyltetrahydropterin/6-carboxytetrahydropterin synthase|nr:6-pyruvoyl tetrahydropterin synthase family protein [Methanomassiliicoccales archaeon]